MILELKDLHEEFLSENPHLIHLSKKYNRARTFGLATIFITILTHIVNFAFFENTTLGIGMVIIPTLILIVLYVTGEPNFYEEFDMVKGKYLQRMLDKMENCTLQHMDTPVEMNYEEVEEVGFLKQNIHPDFRPMRKNYISGTYKNVEIKIGEFNLKHRTKKNRIINMEWNPSTLLVFDYPSQIDEAKVSFYTKTSATYGRKQSRSISTHDKIVKLDGTVVKTNIKIIDHKFLTYTTDQMASQTLLSDDFKSKLKHFNTWYYKPEGDKYICDAKFLTVYKDKMSILIFNRRFLQVRMDNIFESYHEELQSILQFVDMFSPETNKTL